jgi:peptidyl-prolyl cis-trans isomerase-like 3
MGSVIDGVDSTLDMIEKSPVNEKNRPIKEIKLINVCRIVEQ